MKRIYLSPEEVEQEMQKSRDADGFVGNAEKTIIKNIVESAKKEQPYRR